MLNRPGVVTVVGEFVAARMAEHVRMNGEGQAGESTRPRHDLQTVAIRDENQRRIAMAVAARSPGSAYELLDLVGRQVLAAPNGAIRNRLGRPVPHEISNEAPGV